jgi:hypothetical protein
VITGDEYRHTLEHGFTGSIDQVVKLLLVVSINLRKFFLPQSEEFTYET